ncbi:MAG: MaoC family dehydratase [Natronomonas sp.]
MFNSVMEANRAAIAAFGVPDSDLAAASVPPTPGITTTDDCDDLASRAEQRISPDENLPEWEVDVDADEDLSVGDVVRFSKTLSEEDVERFAAASGDTNPLHLDEDWAEDTRFNGRIVHGTLAAGLISAALARLPGGVIYLSQDVEFRAPIRLGDRVTAEVEVVEDLGGGRYRLRTTVESDGDLAIDGEAVVLIAEL